MDSVKSYCLFVLQLMTLMVGDGVFFRLGSPVQGGCRSVRVFNVGEGWRVVG